VFLFVNLNSLPFNVESQPVEDGHVLIRDPNQSKETEQIASPVVIDQLEMRYREKERRYPVAEAVFTGKQVEELPLNQSRRLAAAAHTEFPGLAEDLFMRNRPTDARNGNGDEQQLDGLKT